MAISCRDVDQQREDALRHGQRAVDAQRSPEPEAPLLHRQKACAPLLERLDSLGPWRVAVLVAHALRRLLAGAGTLWRAIASSTRVVFRGAGGPWQRSCQRPRR
ncbi:MAG TPA: hypothetical protein VI542_12605 [Candidatus Tectomicrobia bacterium]